MKYTVAIKKDKEKNIGLMYDPRFIKHNKKAKTLYNLFFEEFPKCNIYEIETEKNALTYIKSIGLGNGLAIKEDICLFILDTQEITLDTQAKINQILKNHSKV